MPTSVLPNIFMCVYVARQVKLGKRMGKTQQAGLWVDGSRKMGLGSGISRADLSRIIGAAAPFLQVRESNSPCPG